MSSLRYLIASFGIAVALQYAPGQYPFHASQHQLGDRPVLSGEYVCEHPPYKVLMVSQSPLVIYIQNFLTTDERAHLQRITKDTFTRSGVTSNNNHNNQDKSSTTNNHNSALRTSQSTTLPPSDPIVACIETRALLFQGYDTPRSHLEPLQLVKYAPTEHYHFHTDWFTSPGSEGNNRVTSFFAYVHVANGTTGGGTNFPRLGEVPAEGRWCDEGILDCDAEWEKGVTFRPVEGNAVFWVNLLPPDGKGGRVGDERTLHAGLPVTGGGKIGLNIWTREGPVAERTGL